MKAAKFIPQIIAAIIILGVVVIPLLGAFEDKASYDTTVYDNEGSAVKMKYIDAGSGSYTVALSDGKVTTSGNAGGVITLPVPGTVDLPIFISSGLVAEATAAGGVAVYTASGIATGTTFSMTASAGQVTYSIDSGAAVQTTYDKAAIAYRGAESSQQTAASQMYYTSESQIYGYRYDTSTSALYTFIGGASYTNGAEASFIVTSTDVEGTGGDVKKLTDIKYTSSRSLTHIVMEDAPELRVEKDPGLAMSLIGIVGVILIAGLVLTVARTVVVDRYDD